MNFKWLYMHDGFIISSAIGNQLEKMKTHHLAWASAGDSLTSLLATSDFRYSAPLAPVSGPWSQLAWVITARHFLFFRPSRQRKRRLCSIALRAAPRMAMCGSWRPCTRGQAPEQLCAINVATCPSFLHKKVPTAFFTVLDPPGTKELV